VTEAESLAIILCNDICAQMLSRLRRAVQQVIDELGHKKDLLESILKEKLQEIDARRRELDSLECKAVEVESFAGPSFGQAEESSLSYSKPRDLFY